MNFKKKFKDIYPLIKTDNFDDSLNHDPEEKNKVLRLEKLKGFAPKA